MNSLILKSIFEGIESKEKSAGKLYKTLAIKTSNVEIHKALETMSRDELSHKKFFNETNLSSLKVVNEKDLANISKKLTEKVVFDLDNVLDVINKAIAEETFAEKAYLVLANNLSPEINDKLREFAKQEALHREILIKLKDEFTNKDWLN